MEAAEVIAIIALIGSAIGGVMLCKLKKIDSPCLHVTFFRQKSQAGEDGRDSRQPETTPKPSFPLLSLMTMKRTPTPNGNV
jgi:hypothetical protein